MKNRRHSQKDMFPPLADASLVEVIHERTVNFLTSDFEVIEYDLYPMSVSSGLLYNYDCTFLSKLKVFEKKKICN